MTTVSAWTKRHKTTASALVISLVAGSLLAVAALHPGFPISDVQLNARDVWVTNGEKLLGGRLNRQIDELNGSVVASTANFDVLQDGDSLFMLDPDAGRVESVSPASTDVTSAIDVPKGAEVSYGGSVIAILSPAGELWAIPSVGDLQFNFVATPPILKLGKGAHAVVTGDGVVVAVSPSKKAVYRIASLADAPVKSAFPAVGEFQISAVGDEAVVLDQSTNELVKEDGTVFDLGDDAALRLQQVGEANEYALVATGGSLLKVALGDGETEVVSANIADPTTDAGDVAAPVWLDGCAHGAWAGSQTYVESCDDAEPAVKEIPQPTAGSTLAFRVNRSVIALNDLSNGNAWLMDENMRLVDNWDDIIPPEEQESEEEGDEKSAIQSFEDTLADRSETNRPPTAIDDEFGIRPGRTTILPLLDNDTDPDGDVLVISAFDPVAETTGRLDEIDGGRALQFTPAPDFVGTIAFTYTVDDGRQGTDQARVTARVVPASSNEVPVAVREAGVSVEANQTVSYNVLTDWRDPDGDDLFLVGANSQSGDLVRFTPDGFITFTHATSELGEKEVSFQVSDGRGTASQGTLTAKVEPAGTLNPIGTPDFATVFVNETAVVEPLLNDLSPSGAQLTLAAIEEPGGGAVASFNPDTGSVTFSAADTGIYYLKYTLAAGANTSIGIVRIDVREKPSDDKIPPVAVKDTAYLRGDEPVTVSVLANDVSPTGRVMAVQSVDVAPELVAKGLVVELLESTLVRVTSPAALTEQVDFSYTISDGTSTATAGITVVPVPALTKHQPPVAANDSARVRVGDITTLDVLANDFHPDDSTMTVEEQLVTPPSDGLAFVSENKLRFQAPMTPGEYRVDYRVIDPFKETATATAIFTVTALDNKGNQNPVPAPLVGRVLAGGSIRIDVPLAGIDPDGDSAQLLSFPTSPALGGVTEVGTDYFTYESSDASAGTDVFSYEVYDAFGGTGQAEIKIAVIPPPEEMQQPNAVPDSVAVRPGRIAQVDLLANDSDPQGSPIKVSKALVDVPEGIKAKVVDRRYLVLTAPDEEQSFSLRYELTNALGGKTMSYVLVKVTPDAPILPPTADDLAITQKEIAGEESVTVDVFDGYAFNPSGETKDLVVSIEGPNKGSAELLETNGRIQVTPGETRQAIAYRVLNEDDELSAMAFILVPAAVEEGFDDPPRIDPDLPVQYVSMNETREWKLADILDVPSGRDAWIRDPDTVNAVQSNGEPNYVDKDTIRFTPPLDYRGPAAINFTAFDGETAKDPKGISAPLRLNIVVGDPEFRDEPPVFTTPNQPVEVGEKVTIDLRASTSHNNPQILQEVTYSDLSGTSDSVRASLSGSQLTLEVPRNAKKGSTFTLGVTLKWDKFVVPGKINVSIVGSSRPLAVAVTDTLEMKRGAGNGTITVAPLGNDSNPYQTTGEPLTIVSAAVQNTGQPATIRQTADSVSITPSPTLKSGVIEVVYTVQDATEDKDRQVNGTITLTVSDVPDQVAKPTRASEIGGDRTATFRFIAPAANGKPITSYEVSTNPSVAVPSNCTAGADCVVSNLENGQPYTLMARAINQHGAGAWSVMSDPVTPYGTPSTPQPALQSQDKWAAASITWTWPEVNSGGGSTSYAWRASNGATGTGRTATINGVGAGTYTVEVTATNSGRKSSAPGTSAPASVRNQPVPGAPGGPSGSRSGQYAPASIDWSWGAITGEAGEGVTYHWSVNGGGTTSTTSTGARSNNLGPGDYTLTVFARNKGGDSGQARSNTVTIEKKPDPPQTEWTLTANVNTCPEDSSFRGRWAPGSCESPGYVQNGRNVVVSCRLPRSGAGSYDSWYRIVRGSGHALYDSGGWYLADTTMSGSTAGMPNC